MSGDDGRFRSNRTGVAIRWAALAFVVLAWVSMCSIATTRLDLPPIPARVAP